MRRATAGFHSDLHIKNITWECFLETGTAGHAGFTAAFAKIFICYQLLTAPWASKCKYNGCKRGGRKQIDEDKRKRGSQTRLMNGKRHCWQSWQHGGWMISNRAIVSQKRSVNVESHKADVKFRCAKTSGEATAQRSQILCPLAWRFTSEETGKQMITTSTCTGRVFFWRIILSSVLLDRNIKKKQQHCGGFKRVEMCSSIQF